MYEAKPELSVVMPVRNAQRVVAQRLESLLDAIAGMVDGPTEVLVVDDASEDGTEESVESLALRFPQLRLIRHPRRLGFELAGQTGLEHAQADVVFICEDDRPIRIADLRQLWRLAEDRSLVAARAESSPSPLSRSFAQRFQQLARRSLPVATADSPTSIQMLRRPSLNYLSQHPEADTERDSFQTESIETFV